MLLLTKWLISIAGALPPEWTGMMQLTVLGLARNNISGTLPEEWGQLGAFPELNLLFLLNNELTGEHACGA